MVWLLTGLHCALYHQFWLGIDMALSIFFQRRIYPFPIVLIVTLQLGRKGHGTNRLCVQNRDHLMKTWTKGHPCNRIIRSRHFLLSNWKYMLPICNSIFVLVRWGWGIPLGDLELMRLLFSAIAVGKTDGHPAAFGADILSLKPITSRRISGWEGTPSSLKAIEKSREVTGPHASDLSS